MESKHHRDHLPVTLENASAAEMSTVERLKSASEGLFYVHSTHESRHTMRSEIDALSARQAETITEHAKEISKHFGIYKQRERNESGKKDGDFIFMVRVKIPAGELTPPQWLALDAAADRYADGSLRLTARQGVQFHYVRGHNLSALIRHINASISDHGYQLTTLGACGDLNRNTVASPIDDLDADGMLAPQLIGRITLGIQREPSIELDVFERPRQRVQSDRFTHRVVVLRSSSCIELLKVPARNGISDLIRLADRHQCTPPQSFI